MSAAQDWAAFCVAIGIGAADAKDKTIRVLYARSFAKWKLKQKEAK